MKNNKTLNDLLLAELAAVMMEPEANQSEEINEIFKGIKNAMVKRGQVKTCIEGYRKFFNLLNTALEKTIDAYKHDFPLDNCKGQKAKQRARGKSTLSPEDAKAQDEAKIAKVAKYLGKSFDSVKAWFKDDPDFAFSRNVSTTRRRKRVSSLAAVMNMKTTPKLDAKFDKFKNAYKELVKLRKLVKQFSEFENKHHDLQVAGKDTTDIVMALRDHKRNVNTMLNRLQQNYDVIVIPHESINEAVGGGAPKTKDIALVQKWQGFLNRVMGEYPTIDDTTGESADWVGQLYKLAKSCQVAEHASLENLFQTCHRLLTTILRACHQIAEELANCTPVLNSENEMIQQVNAAYKRIGRITTPINIKSPDLHEDYKKILDPELKKYYTYKHEQTTDNNDRKVGSPETSGTAT